MIRNWLFGWYIVEFEQSGAERSELYGKSLINRLSKELKTLGLKGTFSTNLKLCRTFCLAYQKIQQTLPVISFDAIASASKMLQKLSATLAGSFAFGWTHYVALLTISNADERRFYEIEARENSWGARELERQIAASLYERLALSRDKEGIRQLSQKGLVVEKPGDVIRTPLCLSFWIWKRRTRIQNMHLKRPLSPPSNTFCWISAEAERGGR